MGAGERVFHPPELVDDPLALFPGAGGASLDCPPAGNDPGDTLPVADHLCRFPADKVADNFVDDRSLLDTAKHDRNCPDQEGIAAKLFKDETFERKRREQVAEYCCFFRSTVQDHRADQFLRGAFLLVLPAHLLVEDTLMGSMLVDEEQFVITCSRKDIDP